MNCGRSHSVDRTVRFALATSMIVLTRSFTGLRLNFVALARTPSRSPLAMAAVRRRHNHTSAPQSKKSGASYSMSSDESDSEHEHGHAHANGDAHSHSLFHSHGPEHDHDHAAGNKMVLDALAGKGPSRARLQPPRAWLNALAQATAAGA